MSAIDLSVLQPISWVAAGVGVCVAAVYYVLTLRATLQTRKAQIMMDIFNKWRWDEIIRVSNWKFSSADEFMDIFRDENWEKATMFNNVFAVYEQMGVMLHEGLIDMRPVARGFGGFYKSQWEKWAPYIIHQRKVWGAPRDWIEAEYFYDKLIEFAKQHPEYHILEHQADSFLKAGNMDAQ